MITGPLNKNAASADIFSGRSIGKIVVHPTDPATIFVASTTGLGGIGGFSTTTAASPNVGVYRSTNATSASPTFTQIGPLPAPNNNFSVHDIALDPLNPNLLVANLVASGGGIYTCSNALAASPTFTNTQTFTGGTGTLNTEFAIQHTTGPNPVIYAATGNGGGRVLRSIDGGISWVQQISNGFCGGQCFYDIAVAVDPTDSTKVYLGGDPTLIFGFSTTSATSFTTSAGGLHGDSHAIAVAPSSPSTIYFGSDGGIYKSTNSGASWSVLNNTQFSATQFISLALHPTDPNFTIGGTQDNGTNFFRPNATWTRADFGDGGYAQIDQNAADTTNVRMYHTYFNTDALQGYATVSTTASATDGNWTFRGCQSAGTTGNGITCSGSTLFYAPLARGPGNPNTIYFGTDRLYRSVDAGLNHTSASQNPITAGDPISAIGISPQNDNVRIVGLSGGGIWGTTTGSTTLTNLDTGNAVPNAFIARAVIDPTNVNTAYVTLSAFGLTNLWRTTNLNSATPTWTAVAGSGATALPLVPVNAFVVDPSSPSTLYAGTDIGVYISTNSGSTWAPFGTNLPRVSVFDMGITSNASRKLRIATHGRGMYEMSLVTGPTPTPTATPCAGTSATVSYTGPAVSVPDNVPAGVNISLPVTGVGTITDLDFRFDTGGTCDGSLGNTNAAMNHTFVGDLSFKLTSPTGTAVTFQASRGGDRDNICLSTLDDDGGFPNISTLTSVNGQPQTGSFAPETTGQLSAFDGQNANGTWVLNVNDTGAIDTGSMRRFSLVFTRTGTCTTGTPTNTPTNTPTATPTATPTITATPTATPCAGGITTTSYTGPAVVIPDNTAAGVNINLPVAGSGTISDLDFRFDTAGTCDATIGNSNSAVDHTFIGDLTFKLTSPAGTAVTFQARRGGTRENICLSTLDDDGGFPNISTLTSVSGSSQVGSFAPETTGQLSAYDGQSATGTWVLNVSDNAGVDTGSLRRFSLIITRTGTCASPTATPTATPTPPATRRPFDFDNDGKADLSIFRPSNGIWFIDRSRDGLYVLQFGANGDKIAPADFDNDGKADIAVYRPAQGAWYVFNSATSTVVVTNFGIAQDLPVPGDYDGDGRADIAVYRPSDGTWYLNRTTGGLAITQFGATGDVPAPGDYDGDGRADLVVWRPSNGVWFERRSQLGDFAIQFGASTDKVAPADYDGDGKFDVAIFRPSQGTWYIVNSSNGGYPVFVFGLSSDIPVPADYDGDGRADIAVFRPSDRTWYLSRTTAGLSITQFGLTGDKPVPNAFGN